MSVLPSVTQLSGHKQEAQNCPGTHDTKGKSQPPKATCTPIFLFFVFALLLNMVKTEN